MYRVPTRLLRRFSERNEPPSQKQKTQPTTKKKKPTVTYCRQPYDGVKVDVFSVGCMAFMMFTGMPPFDEATRLDPKFRKVVFKGDLQGYLRAYGRPPLPEPVREERGERTKDPPCWP